MAGGSAGGSEARGAPGCAHLLELGRVLHLEVHLRVVLRRGGAEARGAVSVRSNPPSRARAAHPEAREVGAERPGDAPGP